MTPDVNVEFRHYAYGLAVTSDQPLALPTDGIGDLGDVSLASASDEFFEACRGAVHFASSPDEFYQYGFLDDGASYVRWGRVGEFLVSPDGREVRYRQDAEATFESFQVYMLGQALSFAIVGQGLEILHATAVVVGDRAVAFLGESGFGKSTLAAAFLRAGFRILTDDGLMVREAAGRLVAYPGPARIKLFPHVASAFLGSDPQGPAMNPWTPKLVLPLAPDEAHAQPVPLAALFVLAPPDDDAPEVPSLEELSARESVVELLRGTFNRRVAGAARLERQLSMATRLAERSRVTRISYARTPAAAARLVDMIVWNCLPR